VRTFVGAIFLCSASLFAFTGLRTNITLVKGSEMWLCCALIVLVTTAGKLQWLHACVLASLLSALDLQFMGPSSSGPRLTLPAHAV
jgi:hypothetical protein